MAILFVHTILAAHAEEKKGPPNIVFILADDLGYGDVQALNPKRGKIPTPHLDRFAGQGIVFTDAHSGSAVCTPTRYGLLTGRYAWRTRLQKGVLDGGDDPPLIAVDRPTVASFLRGTGYHTACLGKWHLGYQSRSTKPLEPKQGKGKNIIPVGIRIVGGPAERGFDHFWGCSNARTMQALVQGSHIVEHIEPITMLPRLANQAVSYLEERAAADQNGRPFFLYLPLTSPHTPIVPAQEWQGKSSLGAYADFVMQTDDVIGQVLAALDRLKLADNTLVIVSSDNGCSPAAGTTKLEMQGHFASGESRGYKSDIWEGGHRVPFLARWPGKIKAGVTSSQLICLGDFFATTAAIVGSPVPENAAEDSLNILPALMGESTPAALAERTVVHHSIEGKFAIRQGPWKLCFCEGSGGWSSGGKTGHKLQLYHLDKDRGEQTDRSQDQDPAVQEVVQRLTAKMRENIDRGRSTPGPDQQNDVAVKWNAD